MTTQRTPSKIIRFDFNEANIITETSHRAKDRTSFANCLTTLAKYTSDPYLVSCIEEIQRKLSSLNDEDFQILIEAAKSGQVLFPKDYSLPKTSEISL